MTFAPSQADHSTPSQSSRTPSPLLAAFLLATLTGCQSLTLNATAPQLRIVDASPDAPMLDVYRGSTALTYNLAFGNITSYIPTTPGTHDLSVNFSGSRQLLATLHEPLAPSAQYTLIVGGTTSTLQPILLKDQSTPAPAGQAALRFVDQINAEAPVDIYLVPTGTSASTVSPLLVNQTFAAISGYLNIPAGSYRLVLYPTGASPSSTLRPTYSGNTIAYPSGTARTILLLDQKTSFPSPVQAITANDFDPPNPAPQNP